MSDAFRLPVEIQIEIEVGPGCDLDFSLTQTMPLCYFAILLYAPCIPNLTAVKIMEPKNRHSDTLDQKSRLIELARECRFINSGQLTVLLEKATQDPSAGAPDMLRQEAGLSDEKIAHLTALDAHLRTRGRDRRFGRIAVANGLVSEAALSRALAYQKSVFKNTGENKRIGDILVDSGQLTASDQVAILLTQNRIRNDRLLEAFRHLGESRHQKERISKLFGAFAIQRELATREQVIDALKRQKLEKSAGRPFRFIGEILAQSMGLADADIRDILTEQTLFEKRRLDLENALYTVQAELKICKSLGSLFTYDISKDGVYARVTKKREPEKPVPVYDFLIWLRRTGIRFGIVGDAVLEDFLRNAEPGTCIAVAKGYPPGPCRDERVEFCFDTGTVKTEPDKADGPPAGNPVKKGAVLARIIPGEQGRPGKSVLGNPIRAEKPKRCVINAGAGVVKLGRDFISRTDGQPVLKNGVTLVVEPAAGTDEDKTINRNIGNDTEETYASANVTLNGDITREGIVRCRSLLLNGSLNGCVICDRDLWVNGDIGTGGPGPASGFQAEVTCQGAVHVSKSVFYARIQSAGKFLAVNGAVVCSDVLAAGGMVVRNVIRSEQGPSVLRFGLTPGDPLIDLDNTIDARRAELRVLNKADDLESLNRRFRKELDEDQVRQARQAILKNLYDIMETPDLYQHDGFEGKLAYLKQLPDFSSVKACYLKIPRTASGRKCFDDIRARAGNISSKAFVAYLKKEIDPDTGADARRIELAFQSRLDDLEKEIENNAGEIRRISDELDRLEAARHKLAGKRVSGLSRSTALIQIRNTCEKGTVIKGRIARYVVPETVYQVGFREILDATGRGAVIELC